MELTYKVSSLYRFIETPLSQTVNLFLIPQAKNYYYSLQFTTSKKSNQTRKQIKNEKSYRKFYTKSINPRAISHCESYQPSKHW